MAARSYALMASIAIFALSNLAQANCNTTLTEQISNAQRVVDSVRQDKPGQWRVVTSEGFVFTGAEAHWLNARLRLVQKNCARGNEETADRVLREVSTFLGAHKRAP